MNPQPTTMISAEVWPTEQAGVRSGAELLGACLMAARPDHARPVSLGFCPHGHDTSNGPRTDIYIASLLPDLFRPPETPASTLARWTDHICNLQKGVGHVFLCTIFRHVAGRARDGTSDATLARIRMLNLLASDLSQALGANVIDIDRAMAGFGARQLGTDYALQGRAAAMVSGHTITAAILAANLDDLFDDALQDGAQQALRGPYALGKGHPGPAPSQPSGSQSHV